VEVFRLCRENFSKELTGKGAAIKGGRWNSPGVELIYTSANRSLAMAEVFVHLSLGTLPDDFVMVVISIPDDITVIKLAEEDLPAGWNSFPYLVSTQYIGDKLVIGNKYCILQVPSAVTKGDFNYLINPHHRDFSGVIIVSAERFPFDKRIFR
jgi:RES domain-containing protein